MKSKRTISLKLVPSKQQAEALLQLQRKCSIVTSHALEHALKNKIYNRIKLHHKLYYTLRSETGLGSQMTCNAIKAASNISKMTRLKKKIHPSLSIKRSIHYDKRTYTLYEDSLSLYTLSGRTKVPFKTGAFQKNYLKQAVAKEAELINKKGTWYFNLVLDYEIADITKNSNLHTKKIMGVDVGENNIAALSTGKIFSGGVIRHTRDKLLHLRKRLQRNGSPSAKQLLRRISGKEVRYMKHTNHVISKAIVQEAVHEGVTDIALEDLTNIRKRIRARKRERTRLHRWSFAQFQTYVHYKAEEKGIQVLYVNPAYSSQLCCVCGQLGRRVKHRFKCVCGNQQHSDINASRNLCRFVQSADRTTCAVNRTNVAFQKRL